MTIQVDSNLNFSTTQTSWQEVCSITISGADDYLILAGTTFWWGSNGSACEIRAIHQTTEIADALGSASEGNVRGHAHSFSLAAIRTCANNDVIKIEAKSSNGWDTLTLEDIYLTIMPKPTNAQVTADLTGGSYNTNTSWHDVASLNISPSGTQDILIMGQISYSASGTGVAIEVRLYDSTGADEIKLANEKLNGMDQYISAGWAFKIASVSAQRTVKLQVRTTNTGTSVQWKDAFVLAFPTDDVDDFNAAYSASGNENGTTLVQAVSKTWTPDTNTIYIILYYASIWTDETGQWYYGVKWRTRYDGTVVVEDAYVGANDSPTYAQINVYGGTLATSSRTDDLYYAAGSSAKTAFYEDACVMAWREAAAGGISIPVVQHHIRRH